MSTSTPDPAPQRPDRMWRNGRPEDQQFDPHEHLYRRAVKADVVGTRMLAAAIPYKNLSVNRQRYSEPADVTFGFPGHGVVRFVVEKVTQKIESGVAGAKPWDFRPTHRPEDDNYSHTEIWAFKDNVRAVDPQPSKEVKKLYRTMMQDHSLVITEPMV